MSMTRVFIPFATLLIVCRAAPSSNQSDAQHANTLYHPSRSSIPESALNLAAELLLSVESLRIRDRVDDDHNIKECLGDGTLGVVYKGTPESTVPRSPSRS